ncbi:UDP-N-acetylglucosamine 2-epimerase (non-hydrolyzing) [bacterium]|nr:UDP-N-acetylglucosamine 2-epimerase (non-hydrolyzing) [bacterium]
MVRNKKIKILCVVGARPNFIKISPLLQELKKYPKFKPILVHTGQHYDYEMSGSFFKELDIPKPDYNLDVGSGSHASQTAKIMIEFEKICLKEKPNLVIVVGDVNSTLAAALVAKKLFIPVAHVEAGLRSRDMKMPEEINRILTDHISDYLFTSCPEANKNLINEGISKKKIFFVGNIMIDTLKSQISKIKSQKYKPKIFKQLNLKPKKYALLTLHRPSNVDSKETLKNLLDTFKIISEKIPIIFPIHPRTLKQIKKFRLKISNKQLKIIPPLNYLETLHLMANSKLILTDSGGIQEETTVLKIPCLTLRKNTERPITVEIGTNTIVGQDRNKILEQVNKILFGKYKKGKIPKYWDGKTAERIGELLKQFLRR